MRNISKKTQNALRRGRKLNPSSEVLTARRSSETPIKKHIREQAEVLHRELKNNGATWAQCVQAIKTKWVPQLKIKYRGK
jgi:hypothetical protein